MDAPSHRHTNIPDNPMHAFQLNELNISQVKTKFLHLKRAGKIIREPPDCTGNESTLDIPIGGSWQDIKKIK